MAGPLPVQDADCAHTGQWEEQKKKGKPHSFLQIFNVHQNKQDAG